MPDPEKEIGKEFPDTGITHLDFQCEHCAGQNSIPMEVLKETLADANAMGTYIVYRKRWKEKMFSEEDIPSIASYAMNYIRTKRDWAERRKISKDE